MYWSYYVRVVERVFSNLLRSTLEVPTEKPLYEHFPFERAYKGQNEAIKTICENDRTILCAHTGAGKTAVFVTASRVLREPTVVIEPRVFLQEQVSRYGSDIVYLRSRSRYPCPLVEKLPPFLKVLFADGARPCDYRVGDVIYVGGAEIPYPCPNCPYELDKERAKTILESGKGIVVMNQGNFIYYLNLINKVRAFVVVDEADEVLRAITSPVVVPAKEVRVTTVEDLLNDAYDYIKYSVREIERRIDELADELEEKEGDKEVFSKIAKLNERLELLKWDLQRLDFFAEHEKDVYYYVKGEKVFVEALPTFLWYYRLFWNCRLCLVTATPPPLKNVKVTSYEVPFKARVLITPMYNMSKTRLGSPEKMRKIFRDVALYMKSVAKVVERLLGSSIKVVVHCANFEYAIEMSKHFEDAIVHSGEDKLENVIRMFNEKVERGWLFVVSAEYGGDFRGVPLQFVLKVPYPPLDERTEAMREKVGETKFRAWYEWTALSKLVQACGRNARVPDYPALTVVVDRSCLYLLRKYSSYCPPWFKNRLVVVERPRRGKVRQ